MSNSTIQHDDHRNDAYRNDVHHSEPTSDIVEDPSKGAAHFEFPEESDIELPNLEIGAPDISLLDTTLINPDELSVAKGAEQSNNMADASNDGTGINNLGNADISDTEIEAIDADSSKIDGSNGLNVSMTLSDADTAYSANIANSEGAANAVSTASAESATNTESVANTVNDQSAHHTESTQNTGDAADTTNSDTAISNSAAPFWGVLKAQGGNTVQHRTAVLRRFVSPVFAAFAVILAVCGVLSLTVWKANPQVDIATPGIKDAYAVSDSGLLGTTDGSVTITASARATKETSAKPEVCAVIASATDAQGWLMGTSYTRITGYSSWSEFSTGHENKSGKAASGDVAFAKSPMWKQVKCASGSVTLTWQKQSGDEVLLVHTMADSEKSPSQSDSSVDATTIVRMQWTRAQVPHFAVPYFVAAIFMLVLAVLCFFVFVIWPKPYVPRASRHGKNRTAGGHRHVHVHVEGTAPLRQDSAALDATETAVLKPTSAPLAVNDSRTIGIDNALFTDSAVSSDGTMIPDGAASSDGAVSSDDILLDSTPSDSVHSKNASMSATINDDNDAAASDSSSSVNMPQIESATQSARITRAASATHISSAETGARILPVESDSSDDIRSSTMSSSHTQGLALDRTRSAHKHVPYRDDIHSDAEPAAGSRMVASDSSSGWAAPLEETPTVSISFADLQDYFARFSSEQSMNENQSSTHAIKAQYTDTNTTEVSNGGPVSSMKDTAKDGAKDTARVAAIHDSRVTEKNTGTKAATSEAVQVTTDATEHDHPNAEKGVNHE